VSWTWRLESADGTDISEKVSGVSASGHPNQSDAESWLGENWRELADAGVARASLFEDERQVYGPMPLTEN
jgi:hypothetical protein